jgi:chorismate-pyruvate lyase
MSSTATAAILPPPPRVHPWACPLHEFYRLAGVALPGTESIPAEQVPEPYRSLLVHDRDMTPTLELFHGADIHLEVLRSYLRGEHYLREVVLHLEGSEEPVEFGANRINLNRLTCTARRLILEGYVPLGRILKDLRIRHINRPQAFLRIEADELIRRSLELSGTPALYGRRNTLRDPQDRIISEVVEILPPVPRAPRLQASNAR